MQGSKLEVERDSRWIVLQQRLVTFLKRVWKLCKFQVRVVTLNCYSDGSISGRGPADVGCLTELCYQFPCVIYCFMHLVISKLIFNYNLIICIKSDLTYTNWIWFLKCIKLLVTFSLYFIFYIFFYMGNIIIVFFPRKIILFVVYKDIITH